MAAIIRDNAPTAVKYAKMAIDTGLDKTLSGGLQIERKALGLVCESGEQIEGAKAFFAKTKARFRQG